MKTTRPSSPSSSPADGIGEITRYNAGIDWIMAALLLGAAVASALYFKVSFNFDFNSRDFNPFVFVPIVLGGFGLKFLATALFTTLRGRKFGEAALEVDGGSVTAGETLRGRVRTVTDLYPTGDYEIWLRCIEAIEKTRVRDGERVSEDFIRWESRQQVAPSGIRSSEGIPFEFAIPADALALGDPAAKGAVRWILGIRAPQKGLDFYSLFGVEVRRRPKAGTTMSATP